MTQVRASKHDVAKQIRSGQHVPDILDCLAQLSNDEVPTPPKLARAMLDILPGEVWGKSDYVWLDPFCKSGIFLREAAGRLLEGLSDQITNFDERRDHIYRDMLWGTSITEMTGVIARRSLYCSRDASGLASVVRFEHEAGNLPFVYARHKFPKKKDGTVTGGCTICGAPFDLERGESRDNHAYSFIHGAYPTEEMQDMKFDVIVGNPPYQTSDGGHSASATAVYHYFVDAAIKQNPRHLVMVTPSRWFVGGRDLGDFRERMISDRHLAKIVDNPTLFDCFPGVEIKGGVSYFLWSRDHDGDCEFSVRVNGEIASAESRDLREGDGVVLRFNGVSSILKKIREHTEFKDVSFRVSAQRPFGLDSNFRKYTKEQVPGAIPLVVRGPEWVWMQRSDVVRNDQDVDVWKVFIPKAGDGHGRIPAKVIGDPFVAGPPSAATQTFIIAASFATEAEANNYAAYLRTKFARFLIHQRKIAQDTSPDNFRFVPNLPMDREWTDDDLYARYDLTVEEIAYIESQVKPMGAFDGDDE